MEAFTRWRFLATFALVTGAALGCDAPAPEREEPRPRPKEERPAEAKRVAVGPNVWLEVQGERRRVLVAAVVCLREGPLEQLLCKRNTKEHEAILSADADARDIHQALLLAKAEPGSPVRFEPRYRPASGTSIRITVQYDEKGKPVTAPARSWVKNIKTGKELDTDWVFAGSRLVANALDKDAPKFYLANEGDVICVSNFESAMLDLPINSPKDDADRAFVAFTDHIPPLGTKVLVFLDPVLPAKPARGKE
jgi:hypothetical protein